MKKKAKVVGLVIWKAKDGWRKRIREETEGAIKLLDEIEGREMLNESLVVP